MNCPVCSQTLSPIKAAGSVVDVCLAGCGGIWFDQFELDRVDEPDESVGNLLAKVTHPKSPVEEQGAKRNCPRCRDILMIRRFYSPRRQVIIDECPQCGGHWLDAGELAAIRQERADENQRRQAVEDYLAKVPPQELNAIVAAARRRFGAPGTGS